MHKLLKNKLFALLVISAPLILLLFALNAGAYRPLRFSEAEFLVITDNLASPELLQRFAEDFRDCIGREDIDVSALTLDRVDGRFLSRDKLDAAVIFRIHPKLCYVAVYEKRGGSYSFYSLVDSFFDLTEYEAVAIGEGGKDMLTVREYIDQRAGAFEESEFIRGYYHSKSGMRMVLSLLNRYDARWNENWTGGGDSWLRVSQSAAKEFIPGPEPVLLVTKKQNFGESDAPAESSPYDLDFKTVGEREISEKYRWAPEWEHFILFEAENVHNGERVAVIEELSNSPYELYKSSEAFHREYRVLHGDGGVTVENKSDFKIREDE